MTFLKHFSFTVSTEARSNISAIRLALSPQFIRQLIHDKWGFGFNHKINERQWETGSTLLLAACANAVPEVALPLIAHPGVDITVGDYFKQTPLSWCLRMRTYPEPITVQLAQLIERALLLRLEERVLYPLRQSYYQKGHTLPMLEYQIVQVIHEHVGDWSEATFSFKQELIAGVLEVTRAWWKCREEMEALEMSIFCLLRKELYQTPHSLSRLEEQIIQIIQNHVDDWPRSKQRFSQEMIQWVLNNNRAWWKHCEDMEMLLVAMEDEIFQMARFLGIQKSIMLNSPVELQALKLAVFAWLQDTIEARPAHGDFLLERHAQLGVQRLLESVELSEALLFSEDRQKKISRLTTSGDERKEISPKKINHYSVY